MGQVTTQHSRKMNRKLLGSVTGSSEVVDAGKGQAFNQQPLGLALEEPRVQNVCMKTVTYPLRLPDDLYKRVQTEARRRRKKISELFRDLIAYGFEALPPVPDTEVIADTWEKLGPAPDVLYDKL